jgi:hypothetical protein
LRASSASAYLRTDGGQVRRQSPDRTIARRGAAFGEVLLTYQVGHDLHRLLWIHDQRRAVAQQFTDAGWLYPLGYSPRQRF